jgi:D-alanine-D-alanine ligase
MNVALVYNQKKEDSRENLSEDVAEPPSTTAVVHDVMLVAHPSLQTADDRYAEWDTWETISAVANALSELHRVTLIEANEDAYQKLLATRPDIVFNIAEGMYGISREAQIPAMLEFLQIPYTGSDPLTLALCLDKSRAKEILSYYKIPTAPFAVVSSTRELSHLDIKLPAIVKPLHEGSSKGIYNTSVVRTNSELKKEVEFVVSHYHEPAIVETFLEGREFTVAMLGNGDNVNVLPIVEINFDSLPEGVNPIYSFEAKWIWDRAQRPLEIFDCPAKITEKLKNKIEDICRKAYTVLRCRDWCRIDVRLDAQGTPHILELNPLPGILPNPEDNSCFPKAARAAGLSYNQLIHAVLAFAAQRYKLDGESSFRSSSKGIL